MQYVNTGDDLLALGSLFERGGEPNQPIREKNLPLALRFYLAALGKQNKDKLSVPSVNMSYKVAVIAYSLDMPLFPGIFPFLETASNAGITNARYLLGLYYEENNDFDQAFQLYKVINSYYIPSKLT